MKDEARVALYARVSTKDQNAETQLQDLRRYSQARGLYVQGEYVDVSVSGRKERRPALDRLMAVVRDRKVDVVVVPAFDRFGRSLAHLVGALADFQHLGIGFISLREQIDLSSPTGRVMFAIIGAMAEFEREIIRERVEAGLRRARNQGKRLGRPPRVFNRDLVTELKAKGLSVRKIAKRVGISARSVQRVLHGVAKTPCQNPPQQGNISAPDSV
jgi:DNA invertase Pin-like site-specific DNA recombinase